MRVDLAQAIAMEWVRRHTLDKEWFWGAYFSGSSLDLAADAELPATSDLDIMIVTTLSAPPLKLGKLVYRGVLLEITYLSREQFRSVEEVLSSYHLVHGLRLEAIIADPSGELTRLQKEISQHFADINWVERRCQNAKQRIENGLRSLDSSAPFHEQVTSWLFPTGVTSHVLLVAGLRNPTIRLRYLAVQNVLAEYGEEEIYLKLLTLLGVTQLTPERARYHLDALTLLFDTAVQIGQTPFFFSTDISQLARPIAIEGSHTLIDTGYHREAFFWIVATFARCQTILAADASLELQRQFTPAFEEAVAELDISSSEDLLQRSKKVLQFIPTLWQTAQKIMLRHPNIKR